MSPFSRCRSSIFAWTLPRFSSRSRRSSLLEFTSCMILTSFSSASLSLSRALRFSCSVFSTAWSYSWRCSGVSFKADSTVRLWIFPSSSSAADRRATACFQVSSRFFTCCSSAWILAWTSRSLMVQCAACFRQLAISGFRCSRAALSAKWAFWASRNSLSSFRRWASASSMILRLAFSSASASAASLRSPADASMVCVASRSAQ
mmetsp:Transcript_16420/g.38957  ORF Transcript_16420/g.38957 Transcript_16420/m.38957 type:complete len:204 (-) Transcript_16420:764-1375(-)